LALASSTVTSFISHLNTHVLWYSLLKSLLKTFIHASKLEGLQCRPTSSLYATNTFRNAGPSSCPQHQLQLMCDAKDDLNAFHIRLFGSAVTAAQNVPTDHRSDDAAAQETVFEEEDDLGYYPDGIKRTLTDDQIAMFRDSEIYSILRERQVRQENAEADGDDPSDHSVSGAAATPEAVIPYETEMDDQGRADRHQPGNSPVDPQGTSQTSAPIFKRKRDFKDLGDRSGKISTRRLVRELDSATVEDQVLDYGDEPAEQLLSTHAHPEIASADDGADHHGESASVPGKKIWWPVIQAT